MKRLSDIFYSVKELLNIHLINLGGNDISLWKLLYFSLMIFLLFYLSGKLKKLLETKALKHYSDIGVRQSVATIIRYCIILLGLVIILQSSGIDLSTITILVGALGVGIGFGLQNITNNFVSGIVILFERPIKVGDRIDVGGTMGKVAAISPRATTIITNDNIAIIVPNSEFISGRVINWSYNDDKVRFKVPVSVAYGCDIRFVEKILLDVASNNPDILKEPPPVARINEFGDSGIQFELRVWSSSLMHFQGKLMSDINFAIYEKFKEHHITIPFPQRDIHIVSGSEIEK
jgi:small-conductance mechanosensitive channel